MKKYIIMMTLLVGVFVSCSDDDTVALPADRGTVTDNMGNTYNWVRIGDLDWTTSNAQNGTPMCDATYFNGWWYDYVFTTEEEQEDIRENYMPEYGNLMTYAEAVASAPEGWHLPSDEDWKDLERALGMGKDADDKGWRGNGGVGDLMRQSGEGTTELDMKIGGVMRMVPVYGSMQLEFVHWKEYGYYWTSTIDPSYTDEESAYYRKFCYSQSGVERQCAVTSKCMSVRWVREAR